MKNKIFAAAIGLAMLGLTSPVYAGCDGIYLSGKAGMAKHTLGDSADTLGQQLKIDDNVWMLAGAIGYRYGYFRVEGEYTWRQQFNKDQTLFGLTNSSEFQTYSYMANFYYDFSPYTMFTPYVMGGLGMTHIEYSFSGTTVTPVTYTANNFTWALGAGLSARMTNRWNIDLGYRFLNMGNLHEASIKAHEVYLGTRYVF